MISAVFLDRDGVVNVNIPRGYVTSPDNLHILPRAAEAIRQLNDRQVPVIVISNQQGVGKGLMSADQLQVVDAELKFRIAAESGGQILQSYYCIHLSSDGCDCRKPRGGQLRSAAAEHSLDLANSIFIGDTPTDIQAGRDAGVGHIALVLSGANKSYVPGAWPEDPDSVHVDLGTAVDWILKKYITDLETV